MCTDCFLLVRLSYILVKETRQQSGIFVWDFHLYIIPDEAYRSVHGGLSKKGEWKYLKKIIFQWVFSIANQSKIFVADLGLETMLFCSPAKKNYTANF